MFHYVLCFVWLPPASCVSHVVSDSGCSIPCCVLFAFLLCLVCPMLSGTLDVPFRVVYCLPSSCVLWNIQSLTTWDTQDIGGRQTIHNTEWNIKSLKTWDTEDTGGRQTIHNTVSCVSHIVSDSGCSIPCCVLLAFLLCLVCPMLSVTLDVQFRVVYCLPSSCVLCAPCTTGNGTSSH
jgi:hypothetical protein